MIRFAFQKDLFACIIEKWIGVGHKWIWKKKNVELTITIAEQDIMEA